MKLTDTFVMSRRQVAVAPSTWGPGTFPGTTGITAVWFRRRWGVLAACYGRIERLDTPERSILALSWSEWLPLVDEGRYGPSCLVRLGADGKMWTAPAVRVIEAELVTEALGTMLDRFDDEGGPWLPEGFTGWWHWGEDER